MPVVGRITSMLGGNSKLWQSSPLGRIGWTALLVAAGCAAGARAGTAIVFPGALAQRGLLALTDFNSHRGCFIRAG